LIVAASGPSLTPELAEKCRGRRVLAINDAYRLIPWADVLYACDAAWWDVHRGCPSFVGERWSSHGDITLPEKTRDRHNDKREAARRYGLSIIQGSSASGFSQDPAIIHYQNCSGFQGLNLALHLTGGPIVLIGYDMHTRNGRHFFGPHPAPLMNQATFEDWAPGFEAANRLKPRRMILNATLGSAIKAFPIMGIDDALASLS